MTFTPIDLETWPRARMFHYFSRMAPTGYSLTVPVDVTGLRAALKARGLKFFPTYLWLVTKCLSEQPEFTTAVRDGVLGTYDSLTPLYAAFHEDDHTFSLMWTEFDEDLEVFHRRYLEDKALWGFGHGVLCRSGLPPENAYTVSALPWVSFEHFAVHSYDCKPYYFPSVEAGKIVEEGGREKLPLSLTCHHAATDGWHVQKFLSRLDEQIAALKG